MFDPAQIRKVDSIDRFKRRSPNAGRRYYKNRFASSEASVVLSQRKGHMHRLQCGRGFRCAVKFLVFVHEHEQHRARRLHFRRSRSVFGSACPSA